MYIPDKPLELSVHLTNACNLKCKHCYTDADCNKNQEVDFDLLKKSIEEIEPLRLVLSGGEPLLLKNRLIELLKSLKWKPYVILCTNGLLITEQTLKEIKPYIHQIQISLDSIKKEIYQNIRGVDALDRVLNAIKLVQESGIKVNISFTIFEENIEEVDDIINYCIKNKITFINVLRQRCVGRSDTHIDYNKIKEIYKTFFEAEKHGIKINIHDPMITEIGKECVCLAARYTMTLSYNNKFLPCSFFVEGVESKDPLWVWKESELFKKIRDRKGTDCLFK